MLAITGLIYLYMPGKVKTTMTELDRLVNIFYDTIKAAARILRKRINPPSAADWYTISWERVFLHRR